jgi:hypothetical protein
MLLGWIAGTMAQSDPAVKEWVPQTSTWQYGLGALGAAVVYLMGVALKRKEPAESA